MKKNFWKKLTAFTLALSLTAGQAALASDALGWDLHIAHAPLAEGVSLTEGKFWSDTYRDLRSESYITYTPKSGMTPAVVFGSTITERSTLSDMARTLEEQGMRVAGGVNGDFYTVATGVPLGLLVTEGVVRSSDGNHCAIGFREDGTAFIGDPGMAVTAAWGDETLDITGGINKGRRLTGERGGPLLLTEEFGKDTGTVDPGVDVILRIQSAPPSWLAFLQSGSENLLPQTEELRIGYRVRCTVEEVKENPGGAIEIPKGCFVLTVNGGESPAILAKVRSLRVGQQVDINLTAENEGWGDAVTALGGFYRLMEGGEVCEAPNPKDTTWTARTARTAAGIKADGTVVLYTLDGLLPGKSVGANLTQIAQRLQELGCVEAICLDGGGSTTLGVTGPGDDGFRVANVPRDGGERKVTNALFFVSSGIATGQPGSLQVEPGDVLALAGARVPLKAWVLDTSYHRMGRAEEVGYTVDGDGTVTDGVFTAGPGEPTTKVNTSQAWITAAQGELTGKAFVTVVADPDKVTLTASGVKGEVQALALRPGQSVELTAGARWRNLDLVSQNECYTWTCDPQVGTVTPDGVFTAGESTAAGELTVKAGSTSVTIPVTVTGHVLRWEDFEGTGSAFTSSEGMTAKLSGDLSHVHSGRQSLELGYDLSEGGVWSQADLAIPQGEKYISMWIFGDGSGNALEARFTRTVSPAAGEEGQTASGAEEIEAAPEETEPAEPEAAPEETGAPEASEPAETEDKPAPAEGEQSRDVTVKVCTLDFTGWQLARVEIPGDAETLSGLGIGPGEGSAVTAGKVWLDHFTVSDEKLDDREAPSITLSVVREVTGASEKTAEEEVPSADSAGEEAAPSEESESRPDSGEMEEIPAGEEKSGPARYILTAQIRDNQDKRLEAGDVTAAYDGKPLEGSWDAEAGVFNARLPEDVTGGDHRITVTARDQSGNLGFASETVSGSGANPFADMVDHWAAKFASYLYSQKISSGVSAGEELLYDPSGTLTRAQFFTMVCLWLDLDVEGAGDTELPFDDREEIPDWALPFVKTVYAQGLLSGSKEGDRLLARPNRGITRSEVMTILGLTLEKGGRVDDLSSFVDRDSVPQWARSYVETLVGRGVIGGYEDNTLRPTALMTRAEAAVVLFALR